MMYVYNVVSKKSQSLSDMVELQKAKDHNERLDTEIRVLRDRVRSLDSERKTLLKMVGYISLMERECYLSKVA